MEDLDPVKNWWCYTNHYTHRTNDTDKPSARQEIIERCRKLDGHVSDNGNGFEQPVVLTCFQPQDIPSIYGEKQIFLYVYGVRKTVYFMFNDPSPDDWFYKTTRGEMLQKFHSMELPFIKDVKLVFKRPYKGACMGPRLFLKLYISGNVPRKKLKDNFQCMQDKRMACLDRRTAHGLTLGQETQWFNAKRASTVGRIKTTDRIWIKEKPDYYEAQVHHADVIFDNLETVDSPFKADKAPIAVFDEILNAVVKPTIDQYASGPTIKVVAHYVSVARGKFETVLGRGQKWTWRKLKKAILHHIFFWVLTAIENTHLDSLVKRYGGYATDEAITVEGVGLREGIKHVYYQTLLIAYEVRASLKTYWLNRVLTPTNEERKRYLSSLARSISNKKRWLVFDIETDHKPHEIKEESITVISAVLFDHESIHALEYVLFFRMPPEVTEDEYSGACGAVPGEKVVELIKSQFPNGEYNDMISGTNFRIIFSRSEAELLKQFKEYSCNSRCSFVGYFNGHKFDLPFLSNRHEIHSLSSESKKKALKLSPEHRPYTFKYSFSFKNDEGAITYDPPNRKHNHKSYGMKQRAETIHKERTKNRETRRVELADKRYNQVHGYQEYDEDQLRSSDEDSTDTDEIENKPGFAAPEPLHGNTSGKYQGFLLASRKVRSVLMTHVTLVDVMLFVGDGRRGCRLDDAAKRFLGFKKYDDDAVNYDNLCNTWHRGDKIKLAGYAMIDTLLTKDLIVVKKLNGFHLTMGELIGLPEREIYIGDSVRRLISIADRLGYSENLLTHDTSLVRNEEYLWVPECEWNSERDYINLRPPGGMSVPDVNGFYYTMCATVDFMSQYPSILQSNNLCLTSLIEVSDIDRLRLVQDRDYVKMTLENVRPHVKHVCEQKGKVCEGGVQSKGNPMNCKFEVQYLKVYYDAYFATELYYKSVLNRSSHDLSVARKMYKGLRDDALAKGDKIGSDVYDLYQLAVKTVNNSLYGGTMRFNGIVGDAVTHTGRSQSRSLAELAAKKHMSIMNGDTDSVFIQLVPDPKDCENFGALARYFQIDPRTTTVTDIVKRLYEEGQAFVDKVNKGCSEEGLQPLFRKPCFLELEKVFLFLCNFAKKNYGGDKILPNLAVTAHRSGMTGKKADTTLVKSRGQFVSIKLIGRRDFDGLFAFVKDLHNFASWEIRHQDRKNAKISELCGRIPENDMDSYAATEARKQIQSRFDEEENRQSSNTALLPLAWLTSRERVGDVDDPKTLATKRAVELCRFRGEDRHDAPMFIEMCRNSSVQVTAGFLKILDTFLSAPMSERFKQKLDKRFAKCNDKSACDKRKREQQAAATRATNKAAQLTKIDVTAMPFKFRVKPETKYAPTEKEWESAEVLRQNIVEKDKALKTERDNGFPSPSVPCPSIFKPENSVTMKRTQERLHMFISTFTDCDPFPPLYMFSTDMAASSLAHLTKDCCLPKQDTACDIWELYVNDLFDRNVRYVYLKWANDRVQFRFEKVVNSQPSTSFGPEDNSWDKSNIHCLNECDTEVLLDMESYREQTRSTPYIVPSYDGKHTFLVNRDSYVANKKNTFAFDISVRTLLESLETMSSEEVMTVKNQVGQSTVVFHNSESTNILPITKILRDDERIMTTWKWLEKPFRVKTFAFKTAVERLNFSSPVPVNTASITFERAENRLVVSDEANFIVIHVALGYNSGMTQKRTYEGQAYHIPHSKQRKKNPGRPQNTPTIDNFFVRKNP